MAVGVVISMLKLSDEQVAEILCRWNSGEATDQYVLAAEFGVSQATVSNIITGKRRAHVKPTGPAPVGRIDAEGRECSRCRKYQPWSEYSPNPYARLTKRQAACKTCRNEKSREVVSADPEARRLAARRDYLLRKYGVTLEQYAELSERQEHKCALCRQPETVRRRQDRHGIVRTVDLLGIDHDHSCARHSSAKACAWCIRGLLCDDCNRMLGFAEAKPLVAVRFSDYFGLRPLLGEGGGAHAALLRAPELRKWLMRGQSTG
jgi:hypothetical protein